MCQPNQQSVHSLDIESAVGWCKDLRSVIAVTTHWSGPGGIASSGSLSWCWLPDWKAHCWLDETLTYVASRFLMSTSCQQRNAYSAAQAAKTPDFRFWYACLKGCCWTAALFFHKLTMHVCSVQIVCLLHAINTQAAKISSHMSKDTGLICNISVLLAACSYKYRLTCSKSSGWVMFTLFT